MAEALPQGPEAPPGAQPAQTCPTPRTPDEAERPHEPGVRVERVQGVPRLALPLHAEKTGADATAAARGLR